MRLVQFSVQKMRFFIKNGPKGYNNNNNNNNNNGHSGGRDPWENQFSYYASWVCTGVGEKETQTQVLSEQKRLKY